MRDVFLTDRFARDEPVYVSWSMLPGALSAQMLARAGFEAAVIDMQHGLIGFADMIAMLTAIHRHGRPVLVRPPLGDDGIIGKALDAGAAGLVVPMINSPDQAAALVAKTKYPPLGERSWGAYLALAACGLDKADYLARANTMFKTFAMIEKSEALEQIEAICATPGLDGVFVGPHDLCLSLTGGEAPDARHRLVAKALPRILAAAGAAGIVPGIYAASAKLANQFAAAGFKLIAVGSDAAFLDDGAGAALAQLAKN